MVASGKAFSSMAKQDKITSFDLVHTYNILLECIKSLNNFTTLNMIKSRLGSYYLISQLNILNGTGILSLLISDWRKQYQICTLPFNY